MTGLVLALALLPVIAGAVAGQAGQRLRVIHLPVLPGPLPPEANRQHPGIPQFGP